METLDTDSSRTAGQGNPRALVVKIVLAVVGGLLLLMMIVDGTYLVRQYHTPWQPLYHQSFDDPRVRVVALGMLAYSQFNLQPWRVVLDYQDSTVFWLYADTSRALRQTDMFARRITFDQGTFLQYAILGAEHLGYQPRVQLFPKGLYGSLGDWVGIDSLPVARVQLIPADRQNPGLYRAMFDVRLPRLPYRDTPVPDILEEFFHRQNQSSRMRLQMVQTEEDRNMLRDILQTALEVDRNLQRIVDEITFLRITEYQKNRYRDGITADAFDYSALGQFLWQVGHAIFPGDQQDAADFLVAGLSQVVQSSPAYVVISSPRNSRVEQLQAGMLYARIQLVASAIGVAVLPIPQVVRDYPEMFNPYVDLHMEFALRGFRVQMVAGLGLPARQVAPEPRRFVMSIVEQEPPPKPPSKKTHLPPPRRTEIRPPSR